MLLQLFLLAAFVLIDDAIFLPCYDKSSQGNESSHSSHYDEMFLLYLPCNSNLQGPCYHTLVCSSMSCIHAKSEN